MSYHLTIEICEFGARFVALRDELIVNQHTIAFPSPKVEVQKSVLSEVFDSTSFLKDDFDETTLSWSHRNSTLVPNTIFSESSPAEIFKLCFGETASHDDIDYNRISELSVVNVFEIPVWVKSFFVIKFPRIVLQHEGTHIIRKSLDSNAFRLKASIAVYNDHCFLAITKHNELHFYSYFDVQTAEDLVYHTLFVLQQKEVLNEQGTIELIEGIGAESTLITKVTEQFARVHDLKKMSVVVNSDYISKSQLLCV